MSAQVYFVPGQTEGRRPFWNGKALTYPMNYLLHVGNVNYYKSVHQPIPTRGNREHPGNFQNKSVSSPFN